MTTTRDLAADEVPVFYRRYVDLVPAGLGLDAALEQSAERLRDYLSTVPAARADYAYAAGKWTIKECLQHLTDSERIFAARALRIGRGDATPLPGFDQDAYAATYAGLPHRTLTDLAAEFTTVRRATRELFAGLPAPAWAHRGTASDQSVTARAIGFITAGHCYHHLKLYRERYA